jgi:hypothetical protein
MSVSGLAITMRWSSKLPPQPTSSRAFSSSGNASTTLWFSSASPSKVWTTGRADLKPPDTMSVASAMP